MVRRPPRRPRRPPPGRAAAHRLHRLRLARPAGLVGLLAVLGPGLLAGLSDDDPAGITTYSILGAEEGRCVAVPAAAVAVSALVLASGFHRVEHVLLALGLTLAAYIVAGFLAGPDWAAVGRGLVRPTMPSSDAGVAIAVATIGTTLAPWGLAFMQSHAVDKRLTTGQLLDERVDVVTGAVLTGVIGVSWRWPARRRSTPRARPSSPATTPAGLWSRSPGSRRPAPCSPSPPWVEPDAP